MRLCDELLKHWLAQLHKLLSNTHFKHKKKHILSQMSVYEKCDSYRIEATCVEMKNKQQRFKMHTHAQIFFNFLITSW